MYMYVCQNVQTLSTSIDIIGVRNRDWKRRLSHQLARTFSVGAEVADSKTDIDIMILKRVVILRGWKLLAVQEQQ